MYLHLGQSFVIASKDIIGIFDLDTASYELRTREFLERAERAGRVITVSTELPKSFVLCARRGQEPLVYISALTAQTLLKRQLLGSVQRTGR